MSLLKKKAKLINLLKYKNTFFFLHISATNISVLIIM